MRHLLIGCLALSACVVTDTGDLDDDHGHEYGDVALGQNASGARQGLTVAGRWLLPDDVAAAGLAQDVQFDNAPPYDGGSNCSGSATPGALTFRDHLLGYFPQIASIGIYNCRVIAGTNSMSLHGVGRALDIMIPTIGGDADNEAGDVIAHWLIENAEFIGVQTVIWDHSIWRVSRSPQFGTYTGSNPHVDHLHVELNVEAGNEGSAWFDGPTGPVSCPALPVAETIVDEAHACFSLFGPAQYWRTEQAGHGGSLRWTNAFENDAPSNWARWSLPFEEPGQYRLEVFVDPMWGVFPQTKYEVKAGGAVHVVTVDQSAADGWTDLGTFTFTATGDEHVRVRDDGAAPVGDGQRVVADALRVTPIGVPTCDPLPATGGVLEEDGPCFDMHGPAQYWRVEAAGSGGALLWTNAFDGDAPSNWAAWRLPVQTTDDYRLSVFLDPAHAQFAATKYAVVQGATTVPVVVDQSTADGWFVLGDFALAAGVAATLQVYDDHDGPVPAEKRIAVDAVRVAPIPAPAVEPPADDDAPPADDDAPPADDDAPPADDDAPPADDGDSPPADDDDPGAAGIASDDDNVERVVLPTSAAACSGTGASPNVAVLAVAAVALGAARRRRRRA